MAYTFLHDTTDSITFKQFIDNINGKISNIYDEEGLLKCSIDLKLLSNNKDFLIEYLNSQLLEKLDDFQLGNVYSSQSFILYRNSNFYVRVNWWPIIKKANLFFDELMKNFSYDLVHDHNFPLLTVGYKGAYTTKIWEYDYYKVNGFIGENVEMDFLEETDLDVGKVMYFRPSKDIHKQLMPKNELSISVNIILDTPINKAQFSFDENKKSINGILNYPKKEIISFFKIIEKINDLETIKILKSLSCSKDDTIKQLSSNTLKEIMRK